MANVKVSALSSLTAIAEEDTLIVNDYSEAAEKVKATTIPNMRLAILLPGVDNTNDIGSAIKRVKNVYVAGDVSIGDDLTVTGDITVNSVLQGKDVTAALHRKIVNIGDWDMDANAAKTVAHGLNYKKIRSIAVVVRDDADTEYCVGTPSAAATGSFPAPTTALLVFGYNSTDVNIYFADVIGYFNSVAFNATSFNRGWITIDYVD